MRIELRFEDGSAVITEMDALKGCRMQYVDRVPYLPTGFRIGQTPPVRLDSNEIAAALDISSRHGAGIRDPRRPSVLAAAHMRPLKDVSVTVERLPAAADGGAIRDRSAEWPDDVGCYRVSIFLNACSNRRSTV